ncbi:MAG: cytochrome ubiquinol oxidase subunit I [Dehalococcoidia bacterium]|nr:cytochrome ubiquinol oxidase subunit I [Dehalococcoidia bacterium]
MDDVTAARSLMGLSLAFHISFTAIGIGLPLMLFLAEGLALRTGDESYRRMAQRWTRVAAVLFAIGAVSGTILSFEFDSSGRPSWSSGARSSDSRSPWRASRSSRKRFSSRSHIFGWDRLSPLTHWLVTVPIIVSAAASAFFVISANAWMNQPDGFDLVDGKITNVRVWDAMFNRAMPYEVVHGTLASYVATGFALAGIYAIAMLRGDRSQLQPQGPVALDGRRGIAIPLQIVSGDFSARFSPSTSRPSSRRWRASSRQKRAHPCASAGFRFRVKARRATQSSFHAWVATSPSETSTPRSRIERLPGRREPDPRLVHIPFQIMVASGLFMLFVAIVFFVLWFGRRSRATANAMLVLIAATLPLWLRRH